MQRADGAFGALIVREPNSEIPTITRSTYDYDSIEYLMMIQHWDRKTAAEKYVMFHFFDNDNHPSNILINGKGPLQHKNDTTSTSKHVTHEVYHVEEKSRYRFRIINAGYAICPMEISIDNHTMNVIASDGDNYIKPISVDSLVVFAGERFDIVVTANQPIGNYWIRVKGLLDCDDRFKTAHQAAILRYKGAKNERPTFKLSYNYHRGGVQMNSLNRSSAHYETLISIAETTSLAPDTPSLLQKNTDYKFYIHFDMFPDDYPGFNDTYSERFDGPQFNQITMKMPSVPYLLAGKANDESKFCNREFFEERNISCIHNFCECEHIYQVPLNATVELILIDGAYELSVGMNHPMHLHGHSFRVVAMEQVKNASLSLQEVSLISVLTILVKNYGK